MQRINPFLFILLLLGQYVYAEEAYLCTTDHAVGFEFNSDMKSWGKANMEAGKKYTIKKNEDNIWKVHNFGETLPLASCGKKISDHGFLNCDGWYLEVRFNNQSLRFQYTYEVGYVISPSVIDDGREGGNAPSMQIGTCSPL